MCVTFRGGGNDGKIFFTRLHFEQRHEKERERERGQKKSFLLTTLFDDFGTILYIPKRFEKSARG